MEAWRVGIQHSMTQTAAENHIESYANAESDFPLAIAIMAILLKHGINEQNRRVKWNE